MSYMGSKDRFSSKAIRGTEQKLGETDEAKACAVYDAMRDINRAEDVIRRVTSQVTRSLQDMEARLDSGPAHLSVSNSIMSAAIDLDRAIAERAQAFRLLEVLLGEDAVREALAAG